MLSPSLLPAVDTRVWEQSDQADFQRGTTNRLSIRSDGHVTLAPALKELDSTNTPYLWALAEDTKGTIYYAGGAPTGATAKVYALTPGGKGRQLAEMPGLEVHALAVDTQGRVYAAVLPDAKIYRISSDGKAELFFDAKCKYIWAMTFDRSGNLYVATGDTGIIYRVSPDGKGTEFFHTEETHARSMTTDDDGNLIVGTEPNGLVMRVSPAGKAFVLFQTDKREVTAVAVRGALIYAAGVGAKNSAASVSGPAPVLPPAPAPPAGGASGARTMPNVAAARPAIGSLSTSVTGGSDFFRIQKDGAADKIWSSPTDLIYAVAFDHSGKPMLGTGNKGVIYRIDSDQLSTQLLNTPPTQVTAFLSAKNGTLYAVSGNVGNLYAIGPSAESKGTLESDVLDAGDFTHWGKAHIKPIGNTKAVALETRSGNLSRPQATWSAWSPVTLSATGGQVQSPPARFLQYRLTLSDGGSSSPEINTVDIAYLPRNEAPRVEQIDIAPFNYRQAATAASLERSVLPSGSPTAITVPAVGARRPPTPPAGLEVGASATLQYNKGWVTVRWKATDSNYDSLLYRVEIRGKDEKAWRLLKDKLEEPFYAFDSTALADGDYVARVTASDAPGNIPANALSSSLESDPLTVDNTPPEISEAARGSESETATFTARDALSWIDKAEFSVDGGTWTTLLPVNGVTDSQMLKYQVHTPTGHSVSVRVFDEHDNVVVKQISNP